MEDCQWKYQHFRRLCYISSVSTSTFKRKSQGDDVLGNSDREWSVMLMCCHTNKKENQDINHWEFLMISLNISPCENTIH